MLPLGLMELQGVSSRTAIHVRVSTHGVSPSTWSLNGRKRLPAALLRARPGCRDVEVHDLAIVRHADVSTYSTADNM